MQSDDRLEAMERLAKLHKDAALTDEEFTAEKRRLFGDVAIGTHGSEAENIAESYSPGRGRPLLLAGLLIVTLLIGGLTYISGWTASLNDPPADVSTETAQTDAVALSPSCDATQVIELVKSIIAEKLIIGVETFDITSIAVDGIDPSTSKQQCVATFGTQWQSGIPLAYTVQPTADGADNLVFVEISRSMRMAAQGVRTRLAIDTIRREEAQAMQRRQAQTSTSDPVGSRMPPLSRSYTHSVDPNQAQTEGMAEGGTTVPE